MKQEIIKKLLCRAAMHPVLVIATDDGKARDMMMSVKKYAERHFPACICRVAMVRDTLYLKGYERVVFISASRWNRQNRQSKWPGEVYCEDKSDIGRVGYCERVPSGLADLEARAI